MRISIVTISYNQARYLRSCMDSVLSQDYDDLEYIIVDPGSTDGSREVIEEYDDRIIKVFEKDDGPADGLNKGFLRATGEVFGFINSDDILLPGALKYVAERFASDYDMDVFCGEGCYIDKFGEVGKRIIPSKFTSRMYALGAVSVFQQGMFFKRKLFEQAGGFEVENRTCWDGELFLDMALNKARFVYDKKKLAGFRVHEDSITFSGVLRDAGVGNQMSLRYKKDKERVFFKAFDRPIMGGDKFLASIARLYKLLRQPNYLMRSIWYKGYFNK